MPTSRPVYPAIAFPIFLIEDRKGEYVIYNMFHQWSDFVTFGRVPPHGQFNAGYVFDSAGFAYRYESECGWPRFSTRWKKFLEVLILPGLLFKVVGYFVYYGPNLLSGEQLDVPEFRKRIFERMQVYEKGRDARQLRKTLDRASSYQEVIKAVDWYRFYGGRRDDDGHLLEENNEQS